MDNKTKIMLSNAGVTLQELNSEDSQVRQAARKKLAAMYPQAKPFLLLKTAKKLTAKVVFGGQLHEYPIQSGINMRSLAGSGGNARDWEILGFSAYGQQQNVQLNAIPVVSGEVNNKPAAKDIVVESALAKLREEKEDDPVTEEAEQSEPIAEDEPQPKRKRGRPRKKKSV